MANNPEHDLQNNLNTKNPVKMTEADSVNILNFMMSITNKYLNYPFSVEYPTLKPMLNKCYYQAKCLHEGVTYGGGLVMLDQVIRTAKILAGHLEGSSDEKKDAVCAALLHKCYEPKRIAEGVQPLTIDQVAKLAGENVAKVIAELATEPAEKDSMPKARQFMAKEENIEKYLKEAPDSLKQYYKQSFQAEQTNTEDEQKKSKVEEWTEKSEWAKTLSPMAQQLLLAEKIVNYEVSRDRPNMKKPLSWHKEYFETRQIMVDAIKQASPMLYQIACKTKNEGMKRINAKMMEQMYNQSRDIA